MPVHGFAHITGGGLTDNIPRVLPDGMRSACCDRSALARAIRCSTGWRATGNIADAEMHRTFNCGIGMVVIVARRTCRRRRCSCCARAGETRQLIGEVRRGSGGVVIEA